MPSSLERLRSLSEAATPGPWSPDTSEADDVVIWGNDPSEWIANVGPGFAPDTEAANAAFIVAAVEYVRGLLAATPASDGLDVAGDQPCGTCGTWKRFHGYGEIQGPEYSRDHPWTPASDGLDVELLADIIERAYESGPPTEYGTGPLAKWIAAEYARLSTPYEEGES